MYARINELRLAYDDHGSGTTVLMIHGYPLNRRMWEPQHAALAQTARLIIPDLRGHGESGVVLNADSQPQAYSMELHAADCAALLDKIGIQQPVVVCGLSMGGYISFAFARQYPERVRALVLCATRAGADSPEGRAGRDKAVETALEAGPAAIAESMLPKMMAPETYATQPELVERLKSIMASTSVEGIVGDLLGMKDRLDSTPMLADIQVPTLILNGEQDQIIPASETEIMLAGIPNAHHIEIPHSGHMLNLEQPEAFNQAVYDFLQTIES